MILRPIVVILIAFSCNITWATENIIIETKTGDFFDNLVSDTTLLLDADLKKIIDDDFSRVVSNSKFQLQVNSWKPRPDPKIRLKTIYDSINRNNIKESLASLVQPVVEIACSTQNADLLHEYQSKCIKDMFGYPIIQPIKIEYYYVSGKTVERFVADLKGLNSSNRYQQMVSTIADIMNSVFENKFETKITRDITRVRNNFRIILAA